MFLTSQLFMSRLSITIIRYRTILYLLLLTVILLLALTSAMPVFADGGTGSVTCSGC